jgi:hypothetical protein
MVINSNLPPIGSQFTRTSPTKPATQSANNSTASATAAGAQTLPEIMSSDEVSMIMELAQRSLMSQSNLALGAHGNLSPETAYSLVKS